MRFDSDFVPVLEPDLIRRDLEDETVIWSPRRSAPVALDPVSTVILRVIDGCATVEDLVIDICDVVGIDEAVARAQVERALHQLDTGGALPTSPATTVPERQRELFINPPST